MKKTFQFPVFGDPIGNQFIIPSIRGCQEENRLINWKTVNDLVATADISYLHLIDLDSNEDNVVNIPHVAAIGNCGPTSFEVLMIYGPIFNDFIGSHDEEIGEQS